MTYARVLVDRTFQLAECPLWDAEHRRLVWTDIDAGQLFAMDWATWAFHRIYSGPKVGGFTIQQDGSLLLFRERDVAVLDHHGAVTPILDIPDPAVNRFNDCRALPSGAVIVGTITWPNPGAALHYLSRDGTFSTIATGTSVSNGIALSPDHNWLYWTCTSSKRIFRYAFDAKTDAIGERTVMHEAPEGSGYPDGLTVDTRGRLYSARWGGSALLVLDQKTGAITHRVDMPGKNVTSCAFAGPELDVLVVTIADGPIMAIDGIGHGLPEFRSAIDVRSP